ncbi:MAG: hypothetical protein U9P90_00015 [Patescibacteria group bacterium]|nr:hypothetical protein [Patescibacteria group bacterium]
MQEIEVKFKVNNFDEVISKIEKLGAHLEWEKSTTKSYPQILKEL